MIGDKLLALRTKEINMNKQINKWIKSELEGVERYMIKIYMDLYAEGGGGNNNQHVAPMYLVADSTDGWLADSVRQMENWIQWHFFFWCVCVYTQYILQKSFNFFYILNWI